MSKTETALKLALEALEGCEDVTADVLKAITAIKEALAQPEQEPVAWLYIEPNNPHLNVHYDDVDVSQFPHDEWFPVYRSSPQRTWVGLMDEDLAGCTTEEYKTARYWETKLKEKNT